MPIATEYSTEGPLLVLALLQGGDTRVELAQVVRALVRLLDLRGHLREGLQCVKMLMADENMSHRAFPHNRCGQQQTDPVSNAQNTQPGGLGSGGASITRDRRAPRACVRARARRREYPERTLCPEHVSYQIRAVT